MTTEQRCPRCGTTLPEADEVLCPGCNYAIGGQTLAIEVSPEQLLAEMERQRTVESEPPVPPELTGELESVVTSPSGLLKTDAGIEALVAPEAAERSRALLVVATVICVIVLVLTAVLVVLVGR